MTGETEYTEENGYTTEETKTNNDEILTLDNYKKTVKLVKKRLRGLNVGEYNVTLNKETGEISIEIPENDDSDLIQSTITAKGEFNIIDSDTEDVLMDNSDVKNAEVVYGAKDATTITVYLKVNFDKEGTKKLEEISKTYIKTEGLEDEASEDEALEDTENIKYVSVTIDGETISKTYFGETMSTGILYIPMYETEKTDDLQDVMTSLRTISTIINNGPIEIEYNTDNVTETARITEETIWMGIAILGGILLVASIVLIVKFKTKGFIAMFLQIGFIASILLVVRYTNVIITLEGIVGIYLSVVLNYAFTYMMLHNLRENEKLTGKRIFKFFLYTIPVYVIAVVLSFIPFTRMSSLGMTMFWGSVLIYVYNLLLTKNVLEILNEEK